ncbi:MAG: hypothetical protein ACERK9_10250, partial [Deltaproteobacteria bacterium]
VSRLCPAHLSITARLNARLEIFCDPAHFSALFHFVFLDHRSEGRRTFGGPDKSVAFRPCGVLPGMWS